MTEKQAIERVRSLATRLSSTYSGDFPRWTIKDLDAVEALLAAYDRYKAQTEKNKP